MVCGVDVSGRRQAVHGDPAPDHPDGGPAGPTGAAPHPGRRADAGDFSSFVDRIAAAEVEVTRPGGSAGNRQRARYVSPSQGELVSLDPALFVTPPKGMEVEVSVTDVSGKSPPSVHPTDPVVGPGDGARSVAEAV